MLGNNNWIAPFFEGMLRALTNFGQYKLDFTSSFLRACLGHEPIFRQLKLDFTSSFFEAMLRPLTNFGQ